MNWRVHFHFRQLSIIYICALVYACLACILCLALYTFISIHLLWIQHVFVQTFLLPFPFSTLFFLLTENDFNIWFLDILTQFVFDITLKSDRFWHYVVCLALPSSISRGVWFFYFHAHTIACTRVFYHSSIAPLLHSVFSRLFSLFFFFISFVHFVRFLYVFETNRTHANTHPEHFISVRFILSVFSRIIMLLLLFMLPFLFDILCTTNNTTNLP